MAGRRRPCDGGISRSAVAEQGYSICDLWARSDAIDRNIARSLRSGSHPGTGGAEAIPLSRRGPKAFFKPFQMPYPIGQAGALRQLGRSTGSPRHLRRASRRGSKEAVVIHSAPGRRSSGPGADGEPRIDGGPPARAPNRIARCAAPYARFILFTRVKRRPGGDPGPGRDSQITTRSRASNRDRSCSLQLPSVLRKRRRSPRPKRRRWSVTRPPRGRKPCCPLRLSPSPARGSRSRRPTASPGQRGGAILPHGRRVRYLPQLPVCYGSV